MALRIQTNVAALNAHNNLTASDTSMSKSLERLSSGYRINKAADDAAGLSISEGFRADVASFKVASRNTTEANALLQVAEGGMEQISNMLTRLKELATQAASANVGSSERTKLNNEGNALISEIDRIANSTKYGSSALLDGTFGASKAAGTYIFSSAAAAGAGVYGALTHVYTAQGTGQTAAIFSANFITSLGSTIAYSGTWTFSATAGGVLLLGNGTVTETITVATWSAATGNQTLSFANLGITLTTMSNTINQAFTLTWAGDTAFQMKETGVSGLSVTGATSGTYTFSVAAAGSITLGNGTITQTVTGLTPGTAGTVNFSTLGVSFTIGTKYTENDIEDASFVVTSSGTGNVFQIGSKNDSNNQISLNITGVTATTLNSGLVVDKLDTQAEAQSMLTTVDSALSSLTAARGTIGASMNRLSYAAANLTSTIENMQAADSVIRDVDMAAEMTNFTKQQILMQAGTAMLAQANQAPQLILSLLQ